MDYLSLANTNLFYKISTHDIKKVLNCLQYRLDSYDKGENIFSIGEQVQEIGLILSGSVLIENNDFWGNRSLFAVIKKDHVFAESYSLASEKLMVSVTAAEDTKVLFLNTRSLISMCSNACKFHNQLISNLLSISSSNNIRLSQRILNTSSKTIRGRLISYLSNKAQLNRSNKFNIPLNRQELADYLNVDRSALSNELSKMRNEKLLYFHKNQFQLLDIDSAN